MKFSSASFTGFLLFYVLLNIPLSGQTGIITGVITDAITLEPLPGVNIIVNELNNIGAASDTSGRFIIKVPAGGYSLKVSFLGYTPVVKTDVVVKSESEVKILIHLSETKITTDEVVVRADYFDKSVMENDLSTVILGVEEVRRSPGSSLDVQRVLQGMAGVSYSTDRNNELLVRGGASDENLVILDNMEIHSINHFPDEDNSGGAVNMMNVALLQDIQFSTGGFVSKYGDKLSSVMNISTREGTRNSIFDANLNASTAGVGAILEGRINNGRGSWLFSARNSFLSLVKDAIGLSAVPKYFDLQFKLAYDLSAIHSISLSGIFGHDKLVEEADFDSGINKAGLIDSVSEDYQNVVQQQYAAGVSLRSVWKKNLYSLFTFFLNNYHFDVNEKEEFASRYYNVNGEAATNILNKRTIYNDKHNNGEAAFKGEFVWNISKAYEANVGGMLKTIKYDQNIFLSGDSSRYDIALNGWNTPDDIYTGDRPSQLQYNIKLLDNYKAYAFINNKIKLFDGRLTLNLGLRYDYFSYSGQGNLSPRISASYSIVPALTNVNLSYGDYYQTHAFPVYKDRYKTEVNKNLKNTHAHHFVIGLEQILSDGLKLTLEGYRKEYDNIPVSEEYIHNDDKAFSSERYLNMGKKYAYGFDFFMQQKLVKDIFGTLAYSRMWSLIEDPRIGREGNEYPSEYEYPHILTLICGKRFSGFRHSLNQMPFYIKYLSYLLPFSNDMEISLRWRYASGRVFTPREFLTSSQYYEGGLRWSKGHWEYSSETNSGRFPDYHRLDLAFNSRYNFTSWSLSVYLSIENLYNHKNIARYRYNSDGTREEVYQFALFPVIGLEAEL